MFSLGWSCEEGSSWLMALQYFTQWHSPILGAAITDCLKGYAFNVRRSVIANHHSRLGLRGVQRLVNICRLSRPTLTKLSQNGAFRGMIYRQPYQRMVLPPGGIAALVIHLPTHRGGRPTNSRHDDHLVDISCCLCPKNRVCNGIRAQYGQ